jgi:hypothetical protein
MKLIVFHRILVGTAIGLCIVFAVRSFVLFVRGGTNTDLALGVGAIVVGVALGAYLRTLRGRTV